jgi:hypothetical protein
VHARRYIAFALTFFLAAGAACNARPAATATNPAPQATTPDQQALDKLLAPIALYPDALLAQVLACATSPQQVTEVDKWLKQNQSLKGTQLQEATSQKGFDASFVALVLFPDVLNMMAQNMQWTTEVGKAFLSDQKAVLDSAQRLRSQAQAMGNLKSTPQQTVSTETKDGTTVIVVQPANPQVVYVPQYPQTVYTTPAPAPTTTPTTSTESSDSGGKAAAALVGFALGVVVGAAASDDYYYGPYGWGAWGMGWHTHTVVVTGGAWRVPPYHRYPYTRPVPYGSYRPPANVYAPTNINLNRNVNVNQPARGATARPTPYGAGSTARPTARPATPARQPATTQRAARPASPSYGATNYGSRGYGGGSSPSTTARHSTQTSGTRSGAFSGYQNGQSQRAASNRGRSSASGGGRSRSRSRR